jgi:hypothetical protein
VFAAVATRQVGNRPDRFEPRVKRRRAKIYSHMIKPRDEYKRLAAKAVTKVQVPFTPDPAGTKSSIVR